jgi:hypothetical protein
MSISKSLSILLGLAGVAASVSVAKADIVPAYAWLLLENTIPDLDVAALTEFVGTVPASLSYGAVIGQAKYTASLSGTYDGQALDINYVGNFSSYPGGPVTWTGSGTYGSETWSESGTALFTFPTKTTFTESYYESVNVGSNAAVFDPFMTGSAFVSTTGYLNVTGASVADGNNTTLLPTATDPAHPLPGDTTSDGVCVAGYVVNGACSNTEYIISSSVIDATEPQLRDTGTITVIAAVPEPLYAPLFVIALAALLASVGWSRLRLRPNSLTARPQTRA